jgi:hypothetical protein
VPKRNFKKSQSSCQQAGDDQDIAEIINAVLPWTGSVSNVFAWYRSQCLPSFGDRTAEDLLREGRAEAAKSYINRIAIGGYA